MPDTCNVPERACALTEQGKANLLRLLEGVRGYVNDLLAQGFTINDDGELVPPPPHHR